MAAVGAAGAIEAAAGLGVGRADGDGAFAADGGGEAGGDRGCADAGPGSGDMMLTGGVEAADGKSALVGLPVGTDAGSAATCPVAAGAAGAFHDGA